MYRSILIIHILIGIAALIAGIIAIVAKKGPKLHAKAGKIYYMSMYGIGLSSFVMTLLKFNPFLMAISVFSVYLTYSGKRAIDNWRLKEAYTPVFKDRLPLYIALVTGLFMVGFPVTLMILNHVFFVPVLSVFGVIMLMAVKADLQKYNNPANFTPRNKQWLIHHIGMMGGAYIATFTAFLVNNVHIDQGWILWLSPTVAGTIMITFANIKWRKKLKLNPVQPY